MKVTDDEWSCKIMNDERTCWCMMSHQCIMSDYEVHWWYVHLYTRMPSIQMTVTTPVHRDLRRLNTVPGAEAQRKRQKWIQAVASPSWAAVAPTFCTNMMLAPRTSIRAGDTSDMIHQPSNGRRQLSSSNVQRSSSTWLRMKETRRHVNLQCVATSGYQVKKQDSLQVIGNIGSKT